MIGDLWQAPVWHLPGCPTPPDWTVDWPALEQRYSLLADLAACPQDPVYHAEGNVLTHTAMVCQALAAIPEWRESPVSVRSALFAAALLHDSGKPACTTVDSDGRISSPGHARLGARLARGMLWRLDAAHGGPVPFAARELIVALVRHHSLQVYLLEKDDPRRALLAASQVVRCDWLALLAEADICGRECADKQQLLDLVDLFRAACRQEGCLDAPRRFQSAHSRFLYFRTSGRDPDYLAYDDTRCQVVLMSGLPGAGKDSWIAQHRQDLPVVSLDALRAELQIGPAEPQGKVAAEAHARARGFLRAGRPFVWNATNVSRRSRAHLIELFTAYHASVRIVYLEAPHDELLHRNSTRSATVPNRVLKRFADTLEVPDLTEAHIVEWVVG